jgi:phage terminase small subunit
LPRYSDPLQQRSHTLSGQPDSITFKGVTLKLTHKQEAFAQAIVTGMSQSDAYRAAYKVGDKTKSDTVNQQASRLMADRKIAARVAELRKPVVEAVQITLASHLERLHELSAKAESSGQLSAAITAEVARGKASGLYVEKVAVTGNLFDSVLAAVNGSSLKVVPDEQPG